MFDVKWRVVSGVQTTPGVKRFGFNAVPATGVEDAKRQLRSIVGQTLGIAGTDREIEIISCTETPARAVKDLQDKTASLARANALLREHGGKK